MRLAMDMLYLHLRLIQSALGQKAEAEPVGRCPRERSQGRAAMRGHEVASFPGEMELPLGWSLERVTSFLAKFALSASFATGRDAAHAVSGALIAPVVQAITSSTQNARFTDEVPRRPGPPGRVSLGYKSHTKGRSQASAAGRASPQPRPKGWQQRQSRGVCPNRVTDPSTRSERQNLRVPQGPLRFMGPVSPAIKASLRYWRGRIGSPTRMVPERTTSARTPWRLFNIKARRPWQMASIFAHGSRGA